jgi:hypothetical protein
MLQIVILDSDSGSLMTRKAAATLPSVNIESGQQTCRLLHAGVN